MINAITNLFGAAAKRLGYLKLEEKIIPNVAPQSIPLFSTWIEGKQISECLQTSLIVQKKETLTEVYVRPGLFTSSHQNLLFRSAMRPRRYKIFHEMQRRTFCTQRADRDIINAGPFARVITGNIVKISGGGILILLFAAIVGWIYCENNPEQEVCESIRTQFGIKKKINRIPVSASHYAPRSAPIDQIRKAFSDSKEDHPIIAIVGDPASGKTELSKQYAREHKDQYHHIWFVQVETWENAYRTLALEWRLFSNEEIKFFGGIEKIDIDRIIAEVHHSFGYSGRKKSLIIFDNAQEGFLGKLNGQFPLLTDILITSRSTRWPSVINLSSDKNCQLTVNEGVQILQNYLNNLNFDLNEAKEIVNKFYGCPVVIAQAGMYISRSNIAMKDYIIHFKKRKKEVLQLGALDRLQNEETIDIIVSLNIIMDQLKETEPEAAKLLHYCACLPAKNIPRKFLEKLLNTDPIQLSGYLIALDTLILCDSDVVSIHDLFQEIIDESIKSKKKELLSDLVKTTDGFEDFLLKHPKKAIPIFQQGLEDSLQTRNPDLEKIAEFFNYIGVAYLSLENFPSSLSHFYNALLIREKILGTWDLLTAQSYDNVGSSLKGLGHFELALEYGLKSLEIGEKILGKEHPYTATSYGNVGTTLWSLGYPKPALVYLQKSLDMLLMSGNYDLSIIATYGNIGICLSDLNLFQEALVYNKKALEISKQVLGKEHPETAKAYNNIGVTLSKMGLHEEALRKKYKSLGIYKKVWGRDHPATAGAYSNIGLTLDHLGQYEKALEYQFISIEICEKTLGKEHLDTALSYNNAGTSLSSLGRHSEALKYEKESLLIYEKILGRDHPWTAQINENIGNSLNDLERYEEALKYLLRSLEVRKITNEKNYSKIALSHNNIGFVLMDLGRKEEALQNLQKAFIISCEVHVEKHSDHEYYLKNLIWCLNKQPDQQHCERVKQEVLSICIDKFGKDDPFTQLLQEACHNIDESRSLS